MLAQGRTDSTPHEHAAIGRERPVTSLHVAVAGSKAPKHKPKADG